MNILTVAYMAIEEVRKILAEKYSYTIDIDRESIVYDFIFKDGWLNYIKSNIEKIDNAEEIHGIRLFHTNYNYTLQFLIYIILYQSFELHNKLKKET